MCAEHQQNEYEFLRELLQGIIGACPDVKENPDAEDYNLLIPHRFTPEQREALNNFGLLAARLITKSLKQVLSPATQVSLISVTEEYYKGQKTEGKCFRIALVLEGQVMGWLELPSPTSLAWITQLLGGMVDDKINQEKALSTLESGLLLDVSERVFKAISTASQESNGPEIIFQPIVQETPIDLDIKDNIIEFCRLTFQSSEAENELNFSVVFLSAVLEPIAGLIRPAKKSPDEVRQDLQEHLDEVSMSIKVQLDEVNITLRDIASLKDGDVLLLSKRISEPVDILVSDKKIMKGLPVQYKGRYGVQTQELNT